MTTLFQMQPSFGCYACLRRLIFWDIWKYSAWQVVSGKVKREKTALEIEENTEAKYDVSSLNKAGSEWAES